MTELERPTVLFVCVHNAGRSQMAAAFMEHFAQDRVRVRSAGSNPAERINRAVVEAMSEVGIDLAARVPKPLANEDLSEADVVITMGCGDACPVYPGKRYEDWDLADPSGRSISEIREIRDEIRHRVAGLLEEILSTTP